MADRYRPSPGTPIEDLDTPCLILDMDALEGNMRVVADFYKDRTCKMRPHVKNHKSPRPRPHADTHGRDRRGESARPRSQRQR